MSAVLYREYAALAGLDEENFQWLAYTHHYKEQERCNVLKQRSRKRCKLFGKALFQYCRLCNQARVLPRVCFITRQIHVRDKQKVERNTNPFSSFNGAEHRQVAGDKTAKLLTTVFLQDIEQSFVEDGCIH